ncbi:serine/threonine-protein kinase [Candidatus Uabimicrobium amorphum]|uniref:non-specific serine/threonine protein kinase n=1 Tax=Uabimicrobium amorphum TaxID=2596890 RepID=A0A5S9IUS1_UABAM|nr:serine/threonine-protein kinase [Candidatus Uabimicrobium amorphum]BBM87910.1 serine/threonine-protein kinase PknB [Candidatus Uabimicrobium amorphum]
MTEPNNNNENDINNKPKNTSYIDGEATAFDINKPTTPSNATPQYISGEQTMVPNDDTGTSTEKEISTFAAIPVDQEQSSIPEAIVVQEQSSIPEAIVAQEQSVFSQNQEETVNPESHTMERLPFSGAVEVQEQTINPDDIVAKHPPKKHVDIPNPKETNNIVQEDTLNPDDMTVAYSKDITVPYSEDVTVPLQDNSNFETAKTEALNKNQTQVTNIPQPNEVTNTDDISDRLSAVNIAKKETSKSSRTDPQSHKMENTSRRENVTPPETKKYYQKPQLPSNYQYVKPISKGGQGEVWLVENTNMHRYEAVKILSNIGESGLERFRREIHYMAALNHNNIATIYYANPEEAYFIMENLPQGTFEVVTKDNAMPIEKKVRLLKEVLKGLSFAHQKGFVHRDLKPGNILFSDDMTPKITDFGLAKIQDESDLTKSQAAFGTPSYMSPEQWENAKDATSLCDIWAIGIMLYEIIAGKKPYSDLSSYQLMYAVVAETPIPSPYQNHEEPLTPQQKMLESICLQALAKNHNERYQNAEDMISDIRQYLGDEPSMISQEVYKPKSWLSTAVASMIVVMLFLGGYVGIQLYQLNNMQKEYAKLTPQSTLQDWQAFVDKFSANIIYFTEDNTMLNAAKNHVAQANVKQQNWDKKLNAMRAAFETIKNAKQDSPATIEQWKTFLKKFSQNNPYSKQDEQMYKIASDTVENYAKDLQNQKLKAQKLDREKWRKRSQQMQTQFKTIAKQKASISEKIALWENFLKKNKAPNPYTQQDQKLKKEANTMIASLRKELQKYKKQQAQKTAQKKQWYSQLQRMKKSFETIRKSRRGLQEELSLWKKFTKTYAKENPYTKTDNKMRSYAQNRIKELRLAIENWQNQLAKMQSTFAQLQKKRASVSEWQVFLSQFAQNNPLSQEDERIKNQIRQYLDQIQNNAKYKIIIISKNNKVLKTVQSILAQNGFKVDVLPITARNNEIVYYTVEEPTPNHIMFRVKLIQKIIQKQINNKFSLQRKKLRNKEFEIKIKIK